MTGGSPPGGGGGGGPPVTGGRPGGGGGPPVTGGNPDGPALLVHGCRRLQTVGGGRGVLGFAICKEKEFHII